MSALTGINILELAETAGGEFCGEHNAYIFGDVLKLSTDEQTALMTAGVIE